MRDQQATSRRQIQAVIRSQLDEFSHSLLEVLESYQRQLTREIREKSTASNDDQLSNLKIVARRNPIARHCFATNSDGIILYPNKPVADDPEAIAFYAALPAIIASRPQPTRIENAESAIQGKRSNIGGLYEATNMRAIKSRGLSDSIRSSQYAQSIAPIKSTFQSQWQVWYMDEGTQLILWCELDDGHVAGILLERARWIADFIAALPDGSNHIATQRGTGGRISLINQAGDSLYDWGTLRSRAVDQITDEPLVVRPLNDPLSSWSLKFHANQDLLPKVNTFPLLASLAGIAVVLVALGGYVLSNVQRQIAAAKSRVSFAGQVSHELRTPLTNIRLYAELARCDVESLDSSQEKTKLISRLGVIDTESRRLSRLVSGVLEMVREDGKVRAPQLQSIDVNETIDHVLKQFDPSFHSLGIKIECSSLVSDPIKADADIIEMVLVNLLSNVEKYAASGKLVSVESTVQNGTLVIAVSDRGPGIPKRHHRKIFRPFVRLDDSIQAPSGTGIGLAIASRAARRHGGSLNLVDTATGARFELRIPIDG